MGMLFLNVTFLKVTFKKALDVQKFYEHYWRTLTEPCQNVNQSSENIPCLLGFHEDSLFVCLGLYKNIYWTNTLIWRTFEQFLQ